MSFSFSLLSSLICGCFLLAATVSTAAEGTPAALNFKMKGIDGQEVDLSRYQGKVVLVVNVASKCGLTKQYEELEALHEEYASQGLAVLGFPCNQFGGQEPGSEAEIAAFCSSKYNVTFDMFSKISVNGNKACDLYKHLTSLEAKPQGKGDISWNFEKFVIGRNGEVVARFNPRLSPSDAQLLSVIEAELAKK